MLQGEVSCDVTLGKIVFIPCEIIFQLNQKKHSKIHKGFTINKKMVTRLEHTNSSALFEKYDFLQAFFSFSFFFFFQFLDYTND